jgi:UDP-3-O-[3-hydroxymyristoyl] glucosamine N-acyltransferase
MKGIDLTTIIERVKEIDTSAQPILPKNSLEQVQFSPASLKNIIPHGIYYLANSSEFTGSFEEAVILTDRIFETASSVVIVVANPQLVHYKLCSFFAPAKTHTIHPTAIIDSQAEIGNNVHIGAFSVIGKCKIGDNTQIMHHVVIEDNVIVKNAVFIDSNSVIGAAGMAWVWDENGKRIMQPQFGGVIIEQNTRIGTDVTIVRGSLSENTFIGNGTVIAHGTKIGHGAQVINDVHMANNVSIAGNAKIGERSFLGSACIISSNIEIPSNTVVGAGAVVTKSFKESYLTLAGVPAQILKTDNYSSKPNGAPKPFK